MHKKILFISLFFLNACASLRPSQIPEDWKKPPQPNTIEFSNFPENKEKNLKITILNVGQGDATLIEFPNGKTLLIDAGAPQKGKEVILPFLRQRSLSLNAIIATHYDQDHIGGIAEIINGEDEIFGTRDDVTPLEGVYDRGSTPLDSAPAFPTYLASIQNYRHTLNAGDFLTLDPQITLRCVAANTSLWNGFTSQPIERFSSLENASSIVLLFEYGEFRYLTGGDLTGGGSPGGFSTLDLETPLALSIGAVTAVHTNHHGSDTSSNADYVNTLRPQLALFNVGDGNDYHHPTQSVLERWRDVGAELWLTERGTGGFIAGEHIVNGAIEIATDGTHLTINGQSMSLIED